jgi:ribosomal protein S18 acetylase RimI-like enzyme
VSRSPRRWSVAAKLRRGRISDLDDLIALENAIFTVDLLSRRSFRRFLASRNAALIIAEESEKLAGYALVLYRRRSHKARLYSVAVAPHIGKRGVGPLLLAAAEDDALRHRCRSIRLEVHERNTRAIARYKKSGYRLFGRQPDYYDDHATALRFEKPLAVKNRRGPAGPVKKSDSRARIGFHGGQRARNGRHATRL